MRYRPSYLVACTALAGAVAACSDRLDPATPLRPDATIARSASSNGAAPTVYESNDVYDFVCPGFVVRFEQSGKTKTLTVGKAGATTVILWPALRARLTNLGTGQQVELSITGSFHQTVDANGNIVTVMTGRNIAYDPVTEPHFALVEGVFSFVMDAQGNLVQPRQGQGRSIDLCALID